MTEFGDSLAKGQGINDSIATYDSHTILQK